MKCSNDCCGRVLRTRPKQLVSALLSEAFGKVQLMARSPWSAEGFRGSALQATGIKKAAQKENSSLVFALARSYRI